MSCGSVTHLLSKGQGCRQNRRVPLRLVPPVDLSPKQAVVERIKRPKREPGALQCSKCGGRDTMTIRNGDYINEDGRFVAGTVIEKGICPTCWKRGVRSDMHPEPPKPAT